MKRISLFGAGLAIALVACSSGFLSAAPLGSGPGSPGLAAQFREVYVPPDPALFTIVGRRPAADLAAFSLEDPLKTQHLFAGAPDARQAGDIQPSRFRPQYRALSTAEKDVHDAIKAKAVELEALFAAARDLALPIPTLPPIEPGAELQMVSAIGCLDPRAVYFDDGVKSLELAVMWTVKGLTA